MDNSIKAELEKITQRVEDAFNRNDIAAISVIYTDDARMMGPGIPIATGIKGRMSLHYISFTKIYSTILVYISYLYLFGPFRSMTFFFIIH